MATLVLGAVGSAISGFVGSTIGSVVDRWIVSSLAPGQRIEGARLDNLRITSSTEGAILPRIYGRMRMGGNVIWATDFREETRTTRQGGGNGSGGGSAGLRISDIGRVWADGKPMDLQGVGWRWYPGDVDQPPDPFIAAKMGADATPAYRGTAYVVFEDLALETFGNRQPQLSFEVFRALLQEILQAIWVSFLSFKLLLNGLVTQTSCHSLPLGATLCTRDGAAIALAVSATQFCRVMAG